MVDVKRITLDKQSGRNNLAFDGQLISSTLPESNHYGLYVNGSRLEVDGAGIASTSEYPTFNVNNGHLYFGDVNLTSQGECINITLEDYNTIRSGDLVDGYKRYDKTAIYNIVNDVSTATKVTYELVDGKVQFSDNTESEATENALYLGAGLSENSIDEDETVSNTKCPFVNVKYFDPIVPVGGKIEIEYYVDTQDMASINNSEIGDTFTVIVTTQSGQTSKKTTYAGRFNIETPSFSTSGETWFSVECIDSNGVGSTVQYFDVLVKGSITQNYYTMIEGDLTKYGIVVNNDDVQSAYNNKLALTNFFADVKSGEVDGSNGYNGVVMLKHTYYIDYHATFGTQTYKKATFDQETQVITKIENCTESDVLESGVYRTYPVNTFPVIGDAIYSNDKFNLSKLSEWGWIVGNSLFYVNNTSTDGNIIQFPDEFTIDMNECTFKATQCTDLQSGVIVSLKNNYDTHIINGNLIGNYSGYDFRLAAIRNGVPSPSEHLAVINVWSSKYCTCENLDISQAVGYDGGVGGNTPYSASQYKGVSFTGNTVVDIDNGNVVSYNGMVTSNLIDISNANEIVFTRGGYGNYRMGVQREMFYSFYNSQDVYIKTIKSKQYYLCKVPTGATKVRMSMYGDVAQFTISDSGSGSLQLLCDFAFSKNIKFISCNWHDTRSCVCNDSMVKGVLHKDCTFKNIGGERGRFEVTGFLGDYEDGWQNLKDCAFINCKCHKGKDQKQQQFIIHYANNFTFDGNEGIYIDNRGGIESGFIENSQFPLYKLSVNYAGFHRFVLYKNNIFDELNITFDSQTSMFYVEPLDLGITMIDTTIKKYCGYEYLKLRNSVNEMLGFN